MPQNIAIQVGQLQHDAIIELFQLDATVLGGPVLPFHNGTNQLSANVVFQGITYQRYPIEVEGYETSGQGPIARPTMRIANVMGLLGVLIRDYRNLKGAKLTRRRTLAKYLDAANFPGGVNPTADATTQYPDDVHYLDRIPGRDTAIVVYELASPMDTAGLLLPRRQVTHICPAQWVYRSVGCGYSGPPVAKEDDTPTSVLAEDKCGHRLSSCRLRQWPNNELAFGGFPGAGVMRNV